MKLFGGNKKNEEKAQAQTAEADDFDSPVETISLNAPAQGSAAPQRAVATPQSQQDEDVRPSFGIQQAIALMRTLPVDQNVELVVTVIKTTLESLRVKVSDIIEDASRKQKDIESRVANLKQQIVDFEKEIATRKEEIGRLEADHA